MFFSDTASSVRRLSPHVYRLGRTYARTTTGVPAGVSRQRRRRSAFATRMQPFETACPTRSGRFVPWIATGPPCTHPVSTSENAEIPIAPGPNGPPGSDGTRRWLT